MNSRPFLVHLGQNNTILRRHRSRFGTKGHKQSAACDPRNISELRCRVCVDSCNNGAVSVLEELGEARLCEIIVHRCDRAWWLNAEPEPEPEPLSHAETEAAQRLPGCK